MREECTGTKARGTRRGRKGTVLRRSGEKTVVVSVERRKRHPLYGKVVRYTKKLHVHDENMEASPGDRVSIMETRPLSKMKRWRLLEVEKTAGMDQ